VELGRHRAYGKVCKGAGAARSRVDSNLKQWRCDNSEKTPVIRSKQWYALLPALIYSLIHLAEGETITPMILARRFTLNPVLVIISLFFWHFVWGIPGALLAVPLLAMFKIICDRIEVLKPAGHIIGS
jgi:hypothetical protein